jgi:hypothetical protein
MGLEPGDMPDMAYRVVTGFGQLKNHPKLDDFKNFNGADDGTRTHNNLLGRQEL